MTIHRKVSKVTAMDGHMVTLPDADTDSVDLEVLRVIAAIPLREATIQPL